MDPFSVLENSIEISTTLLIYVIFCMPCLELSIDVFSLYRTINLRTYHLGLTDQV